MYTPQPPPPPYYLSRVVKKESNKLNENMNKKEIRKTLKVLAKLKEIHSGMQYHNNGNIVENINKKIEKYIKLL